MISFVYFDCGGVAIRDFSDTNKWNEMKYDMGLVDEKGKKFDALWKEYDKKYNFNIDYDIDSLIPIISHTCDVKLPSDYSLLSDIVNRFEKNPSMWPVIEKIHKNCRIGLLTNMFPRMLPMIKDRNLLPPTEWDVVVDSVVVGTQKPERKMFELAEKKAGVKKDEILFVENGPGNIQAAKDFGWQTFLYDSANLIKSSHKLSELF